MRLSPGSRESAMQVRSLALAMLLICSEVQGKLASAPPQASEPGAARQMAEFTTGAAAAQAAQADAAARATSSAVPASNAMSTPEDAVEANQDQFPSLPNQPSPAPTPVPTPAPSPTPTTIGLTPAPTPAPVVVAVTPPAALPALTPVPPVLPPTTPIPLVPAAPICVITMCTDASGAADPACCAPVGQGSCKNTYVYSQAGDCAEGIGGYPAAGTCCSPPFAGLDPAGVAVAQAQAKDRTYKIDKNRAIGMGVAVGATALAGIGAGIAAYVSNKTTNANVQTTVGEEDHHVKLADDEVTTFEGEASLMMSAEEAAELAADVEGTKVAMSHALAESSGVDNDQVFVQSITVDGAIAGRRLKEGGSPGRLSTLNVVYEEFLPKGQKLHAANMPSAKLASSFAKEEAKLGHKVKVLDTHVSEPHEGVGTPHSILKGLLIAALVLCLCAVGGGVAYALTNRKSKRGSYDPYGEDQEMEEGDFEPGFGYDEDEFEQSQLMPHGYY